MKNYFINLTKLEMNPIPLESHSNLTNAYHTKVDMKLLNPNLSNLMKEIDVYICKLESFYSKPNFIQGIHTDSYGGDYIKLNWIYCLGKSFMNWYEINEDVDKNKRPQRTSIGTHYILWNPMDVRKVASDELKFPSIVQVGCPHNIVNESEDRICIAAVLKYISSNRRLTMQEARERLSFLI